MLERYSKIEDISLNWLFSYISGTIKSHKVSDEIIDYLSSNIPKTNYDEEICLYRGLYFKDKKLLTSFLETITNGILNETKITSWTEDNIKAFDFMNGSGYEYYNGENNEMGFGIKISTFIPKDNIICSWNDINDWAKLNNIMIPINISNLIKNDSEYIAKPGAYEIEIDHAYKNTKNIIECELNIQQSVISCIEYI